ncbi:MAG: tellurite resistance TerB family protein [Rubripirellula sp.]
MDARGVLDQLLQSGKQMLEDGRERAEDAIGVPESGENRDSMVSGLGKGAIAGGLLALMLGTKTGRSATGKVVKYGGLAAAAAVAYKAYEAWQTQEPEEGSGMSINDLDDDAAQTRGLLLVQAMIAAANADGHIDEKELKTIQGQLSELNLSEESVAMLQSEFAEPLTPVQIADQVDSTAAASEVYLLSSLVIDERNDAERDYLNQLASALRLPMELITRLEAQAFAV